MQRAVLLLFLVVSCVSAASSARAEDSVDRFIFGSYGRIGFSSDLDGGQGRRSQIVPFGPRLTEGDYLELDFGYQAWKGKEAEVVVKTTLGFSDQLFHYTGKWDASMSLRQAFLEASKLYGTGAYVWLGSRFHRGDDIYLLDFWPMDEQNALGLGLGWRGDKSELVLHTGVNRLENTFQVQRVPVPDLQFGATDVTFLDRQRSITSLSAEQRFGGDNGAVGQKLKLYGEFHYLPSGTRRLSMDYSDTEHMADDRGWMLGLQYGAWNWGRNSHVNAWLRYASGLAAFDELATPTAVNLDRRAVDASEVRLAFSSNAEFAGEGMNYGVAVGGYYRYFEDGDGQDKDFDDRQEVALAVRPQLYLGLFTPAVEASVQLSRPNGLNPRTNEQGMAQVTQLGFVPAITFSDNPGTYARPQLRLIYSVSLLNQEAMDRYPEDDPRSSQDVVHFVGARAEWWFGRGGGY